MAFGEKKNTRSAWSPESQMITWGNTADMLNGIGMQSGCAFSNWQVTVTLTRAIFLQVKLKETQTGCETQTTMGSRKNEMENLSNNINHPFKALTAEEKREA